MLEKQEGRRKETTNKVQKEKEEEDENKPLATAMIPYIKGMSEAVRRILGKYKIRTAFKSTNTLGHMLTKVKVPTPCSERSGVILQDPM